MTKSGSTCTTHHKACACRELIMADLLKDIMQAHADPNDLDYNECDVEMCLWCSKAQELMGSND